MHASSEAAAAEATVTLPADVDLHARPAADFVRAAMGFTSAIEVAQGERSVNAKSLLSLLALGARRGTELHLRAEGEDAPAALSALVACVAALHEG